MGGVRSCLLHAGLAAFSHGKNAIARSDQGRSARFDSQAAARQRAIAGLWELQIEDEVIHLTLSRFTSSTLVIALAALIVFGAVGGSAQQITGRLIGTIADMTGGGIPGAQVSATNQDTGIVPNTKMDAQGNYTFATMAIRRPV
jgi:hypothetical protein